MRFDLKTFRDSKLYDFLMGLPLVFWFGYVGVIKARPNLAAAARYLLSHRTSLFANLNFWALFVSVAFNLLTIYLVMVRTAPVRRTRGYWGRVFGFVGSFLGVGLQYLPRAQLPLSWLVLATLLVIGGTLGSLVALSKLGKSFSIMPEARTLVTTGPYAYARHPLYAMELVTIAGTVVLFRQPWALLLGLGVLAMLVVRSLFEEQVLSEQFPEYADYRKRVKRFGFV